MHSGGLIQPGGVDRGAGRGAPDQTLERGIGLVHVQVGIHHRNRRADVFEDFAETRLADPQRLLGAACAQ